MGLERTTPRSLIELKPKSMVFVKHPVVSENDYGEMMVFFYSNREGLYEFIRMREYVPPVIESHLVEEDNISFSDNGSVLYSNVNLRYYASTLKNLTSKKSDNRFLERWDILKLAGIAKFPWEERR
jgi:hypothetical protein